MVAKQMIKDYVIQRPFHVTVESMTKSASLVLATLMIWHAEKKMSF